jgi:branched-subunit amino acid transport protein
MKKTLKRLLIIALLIIISSIWIEHIYPFLLRKTLYIGSAWSILGNIFLKWIYTIMACFGAMCISHTIDEYFDPPEKRTIMQFITLGEKKYILPYVILRVYGYTSIIALIAIFFPELLLGYAPAYHTNIIWLFTAILSLICIKWMYNSIIKGKLDWMFGENLPDDK